MAGSGRSVTSCSGSICRAARTFCSRSTSTTSAGKRSNSLRDDVRKAMREARITLTGSPAIRGNTVEVRVREADVQQALTKLRELSQPLGGFLGSTGGRSLDVVNAGGGLIQLTVTEPAILERTRQVVDQSIEIIDRRVNASSAWSSPRSSARAPIAFSCRCPASAIPQQLIDVIGTDRQTDVPARRHVDDAPAGAADPSAAGVGNRLRLEGGRRPALPAGKARHRIRRRADRRPAGLRPAHQRADRDAFASIRRAPASSRRSRRRTSAVPSQSCSTTR